MIWASAAAATGDARRADDGVLIADRVFGVADGIDRHAGAGSRALQEIARRLGPRPHPAPRLVRDAFRGANVGLWFADDRTLTLRSTATVMVWWATLVAIGHVGDSRAYLIGDGRVVQLTSDHAGACAGGVEDDVVRLGHHRQPPDPEVRRVRVTHGDRIVLCTDGIWRHASTSDLLACGALLPAAACRRLRSSVPASTTDEASVVVIRFSHLPTTDPGPSLAGTLRIGGGRHPCT